MHAMIDRTHLPRAADGPPLLMGLLGTVGSRRSGVGPGRWAPFVLVCRLGLRIFDSCGMNIDGLGE